MTFHFAMTIDEVLAVALEPARPGQRPDRQSVDCDGGAASRGPGPSDGGRLPPSGVGWTDDDDLRLRRTAVLDQVPKQLLIGGDWRDGAKGTMSVEYPATGESLSEVADASVRRRPPGARCRRRRRPGVGEDRAA